MTILTRIVFSNWDLKTKLKSLDVIPKIQPTTNISTDLCAGLLLVKMTIQWLIHMETHAQAGMMKIHMAVGTTIQSCLYLLVLAALVVVDSYQKVQLFLLVWEILLLLIRNVLMTFQLQMSMGILVSGTMITRTRVVIMISKDLPPQYLAVFVEVD